MTPVAASVPGWINLDLSCFERAGLTPTAFPADGHGGRALEAAVRAGQFAGVAELCLSELTGELLGAGPSAGPDRFTAAALTGCPQVVVPAGLDAVMVPSFRGRGSVKIADNLTCTPTTPEECDRLALDVAQKACAARGPVRVIVPTYGLSWHPELHNPVGERVIVQALANWLYGVEWAEHDLSLREPEFLMFVAIQLAELLGLPPRSGSRQ